MICKLLNLQAGHFKLNHVEIKPDALTLILESRSKRCRCPLCNKYSYQVHSKYQRHLKHLPCFAYKTVIQLIARKYYCRNPLFPQKVFTERFGESIAPNKRMTNQLSELLSSLILQLSGRCAERICHLLHIEVSDTTLARMLYLKPLPEVQTPKVLGVDDWALKKRNLYGTILVDLEHHKIIDLLKDRETATLQHWLEEHPGVEIVSRDRYTNYSNAITGALPHARQVVDRWHLLKNLCEGLHKIVERNHQHLKYARRKEIQQLQKATKAPLLRKHKRAAAKRITLYERRKYQLRQIKVQYQKGVPIQVMARELGMSRNTVKKYLHLKEPPCRRTFLQVNIALFDAYIRKRLKEQPTIQLQLLYKEIKQRGYNGCRSTAYEYFHQYVSRIPQRRVPRLPDIFYVPSKISFLLIRKQQQLTDGEQKLINALCCQCPEIKTAYGLATLFKKMMEQRKGCLLHRWINKVVNSGIAELKSFAKGLLSDITAVKNALTLSWSNGQVEGQINKLKTIKRQMYGRASFDLLRKRLLLDSS